MNIRKQNRRLRLLTPILITLATLVGCLPEKTVAQDSTINNLLLPSSYQTDTVGTLKFEKLGTGKTPLIMLAGLGFDETIFHEFASKNKDRSTIYLLSLPGFGMTSAYPIPPEGNSYAAQSWSNGILRGIRELIRREELSKPALLVHFYVSTHLGLRFAHEHPELISSLIIVGGPATMRFPPPRDTIGLAARIKGVDKYMGPVWFKTVTRKTWLEGNFPPLFYSTDSARGAELYEQANKIIIPIQVQYLCEYWAADYSFYDSLSIPTLVIRPTFHPDLAKKSPMMAPSLHWYMGLWDSLAQNNSNYTLATIPNSGVCLFQDDLPEVEKEINLFLKTGK